MGISRRVVLNGFGQSAALGALATALPAQLRAAEAAAPAAPPATYCVTRLYRSEGGATFNGDMFRDQHVPTMIRAYGKTAERIELRTPEVKEGAPAPQIIAAVNIWFKDVNGFVTKQKAADKDLAASMQKITTAVESYQVDQVLTSLGDDRSTVPVESYVVSTYFPAKEGGTIDTKFFAETFYPKLVQTYGIEALRRVEFTSAATPKAIVTAATHEYVRDIEAYDAAAKREAALFAELKTYTNIAPLQTLTRVHALG